jgi:exonuclease III
MPDAGQHKNHGIVSLKTDIIFVSDIRMCNKSGLSDLGFIKNILSINPYCSYNFYHHSRSNSRGVGILVKKSLNFTCSGEERDPDRDNYLLLRANINNCTVILGSIYGPNETNLEFYNRLQTSIQNLGNYLCILGGDWNATHSCLPLASNPDVINMQALPNINNSKKIKELCANLMLADPFRVLYPNKIEFSFYPWGNVRKNRSRLDFFLISCSITPLVTDCSIKPGVQSRLFDHKAIVLDFSVPKPKSSRPNISNKILNDPDLNVVVELAYLECYCSNLADVNVRNQGLILVGRAHRLIREAGPDPAFLPYSHASLVDTDDRTRTMERLTDTMEELRNHNVNTLQVTVDDDNFLEILINGIRNDVISYQAFIFKTINKSRLSLEKKIENLKLDTEGNFDEISRLEIDLRNINEIEINSELERNPNFETLHSERITPFFIKMAKGSTQERSQSEIKDADGREFGTVAEQRNFIFNHFANSFRKNPNEPDSLAQCIENFLGPAVINHPLVQSLKLDEAERLNLESEFTVEELDAAIEGANKNSAAGLDGLSTRFISRFWHLFRMPLYKYANTVFRKGVLTSSFRCSIIKLIPKKGDAHDIKKWRPISLLGCLYKVISRAVNNRLKSVINRFTSRVQKGFTNHRYIQEVLINVLEKISYCKTNNVNGALLSIDQTRAFDTISHKYMTEVFRFFGFGEQFTKTLNTIGTNRIAAIIFEDGSLSKNFDLETGRTQGDGPSPLLYNMGEQILLLKIELDPRVASVYQHQRFPNFIMDLVPDPRLGGRDLQYNSHLAVESDRSTDKADSFADDNSTATLATAESLGSLKNFVDEFATFSGLHSNAEKTTLLQIGRAEPLPDNVIELGFNVVNQVTLLGLAIDNNLSCLTSHFDTVAHKIENMYNRILGTFSFITCWQNKCM